MDTLVVRNPSNAHSIPASRGSVPQKVLKVPALRVQVVSPVGEEGIVASSKGDIVGVGSRDLRRLEGKVVARRLSLVLGCGNRGHSEVRKGIADGEGCCAASESRGNGKNRRVGIDFVGDTG